jgi:TolA-binding protein
LREGVIAVASNGHEDSLVAPATWGCAIAAKAADVASDGGVNIPPTDLLSGSSDGLTSDSVFRQRATTFDRSSLAAQARLLDRALRSERRSDLFTAEKALRQLLALYPNSIVAPEARAGLERISARRRGRVPRQL